MDKELKELLSTITLTSHIELFKDERYGEYASWYVPDIMISENKMYWYRYVRTVVIKNGHGEYMEAVDSFINNNTKNEKEISCVKSYQM